jgi:hypothetical protein
MIVLVGIRRGSKNRFQQDFRWASHRDHRGKIDGEVPGGGTPRALKDSDVSALSNPSAPPDLGIVTPLLSGNGIIGYRPGQEFCGTICGSATDALTARNRNLTLGSMFTQFEDHQRIPTRRLNQIKLPDHPPSAEFWQ